MWINSLGLDKFVENIGEELQDGTLLVKILDKVHPGLVNWKRVNLNPVGIYKKIENCNYIITLGKELGFSIVSIQGKDFVDGNLKLVLGFMSQVMQHHFLNLFKNLKFGGRDVTEADLVQWVNGKVSGNSIKSFKDPSLKDGLFLIGLLNAIKPGCVNYQLVTKGKTDEERVANAKYVITVARKIGCNIFIVWEDIVEVKQRHIVCFVGELMTLLQ